MKKLVNVVCYFYYRFVSETVAPALHQLARLKERSKFVFAIDNAPYHSRLIDEFKRPQKRKADMEFWLSQQNISYGERELNTELWFEITEFLKTYRGEKYFSDAELKNMQVEYGCLRTTGTSTS